MGRVCVRGGRVLVRRSGGCSPEVLVDVQWRLGGRHEPHGVERRRRRRGDPRRTGGSSSSGRPLGVATGSSPLRGSPTTDASTRRSAATARSSRTSRGGMTARATSRSGPTGRSWPSGAGYSWDTVATFAVGRYGPGRHPRRLVGDHGKLRTRFRARIPDDPVGIVGAPRGSRSSPTAASWRPAVWTAPSTDISTAGSPSSDTAWVGGSRAAPSGRPETLTLHGPRLLDVEPMHRTSRDRCRPILDRVVARPRHPARSRGGARARRRSCSVRGSGAASAARRTWPTTRWKGRADGASPRSRVSSPRPSR